jgi:putative restriction endonuclease
MPNRFELAHMAWPILTQAAAEHRVITYQELATAIGIRLPLVTRFPLGLIVDFCDERDLPQLTSIVVSKSKGVPSSGFKVREEGLGDAQARAFNFDWSTIPIPFPAGTLLTAIETDLEQTSRNVNSFEVGDVEVVVNGRGPYQERFRNQLLRAYSGQCALCDTRHPAMLVASHIVPWSQDSKNRLNPRNGILFCLTHDAAFEAGILYVLPDLTVELEVATMKDLGADLARFLRSYTADTLRTPSGRTAPDPKFLTWRLDKSKAMQRVP